MTGKQNIASFRDKLRSEIVFGFKKLTVLIGLSYFFVLTLFILLLQYGQLMQGEQTLNAYFKQIDIVGSRVFSNLENRGIENFIEGKLSERNAYHRVYEELGKLPLHSSMTIYNADKELVLTTRASNRDGLSDDAYIKIALQNLDGNSQFKITRDNQGNRYLVKLKTIKNREKILGYFALYFDSHNFSSSAEAESVQYFIADGFDNLFVSNSSNHLSTLMKKVDSSFFNHFVIFEKGKIYLTNKNVLSSQLYLYTAILAVPISYLLIFTGLFALLIMFCLLLLSTNLSHKITLHSSDSVDQLVSDLNLIMKGYKVTIDVVTDDEFGYLASKINKMIDTLQRLFHQTLQSEKEKTQFERQLLEAQFNPHFLYNSLESIKVLMYFDVKKAEQMILLLNRVLRYSITSRTREVSLADDLSIVEDYLKVNQIRFEGLDVEITYPSYLADLPIPKLFLLPVVENALHYGMSGSHSLSLSIKVTEENDRITFLVSDNGIGFSDQFLADFSDYIRLEDTQHGLINSYKRLMMMYPSAKIRVQEMSGLNQVIFSIERKVNVSLNHSRR